MDGRESAPAEELRQLITERLRSNGVDGRPLVEPLGGEDVDRLTTFLVRIHMEGWLGRETQATPVEPDDGYPAIPSITEIERNAGKPEFMARLRSIWHWLIDE